MKIQIKHCYPEMTLKYGGFDLRVVSVNTKSVPASLELEGTDKNGDTHRWTLVDHPAEWQKTLQQIVTDLTHIGTKTSPPQVPQRSMS